MSDFGRSVTDVVSKTNFGTALYGFRDELFGGGNDPGILGTGSYDLSTTGMNNALQGQADLQRLLREYASGTRSSQTNDFLMGQGRREVAQTQSLMGGAGRTSANPLLMERELERTKERIDRDNAQRSLLLRSQEQANAEGLLQNLQANQANAAFGMDQMESAIFARNADNRQSVLAAAGAGFSAFASGGVKSSGQTAETEALPAYDQAGERAQFAPRESLNTFTPEFQELTPPGMMGGRSAPNASTPFSNGLKFDSASITSDKEEKKGIKEAGSQKTSSFLDEISKKYPGNKKTAESKSVEGAFFSLLGTVIRGHNKLKTLEDK